MNDKCQQCGCDMWVQGPVYGMVTRHTPHGFDCINLQLATVTAERDEYKQKADTLDMLMDLLQSVTGIDTANMERADAYIAAWQKQRDELSNVTAERDAARESHDRLLKIAEELVGGTDEYWAETEGAGIIRMAHDAIEKARGV